MQSQRALRYLSRGAAPARRRAVARTAAWCASPRAAGAGRRARPTRPPSARTSPTAARIDRHVCAARRDGWALDRPKRRIRRSAPAPAYETADGAEADLDTIHDSLAANDLGALARGRLRALRRAVDVFGFHLADARHPAELRRARARHGRAVRDGRRRHGLCGARRGGARGAADRRARQPARRWPRRINAYGEETAGELAMLRAAADAHRRYGAAAMPHYVISKADSVSDILEVARAAEGGGLLRPREGGLDVDIVPLFETIDDLQRCGRDHGRAVLPAGLSPAARPRAAASRK